MFKGNRVLLRPMQPEDIASQHEFSQNPELYGLDCDYPHVSPLERSRALYETRTTKPDENAAFFAIEADGKYIGDYGLMGLHNRHGNLELGIMIGDRAYWGRGYGRECVKLLLDYGFHYLGVRRIVLTPHAKNERAIRCYRACGFVEEGRPLKALWIEGEYVDRVNMSIFTKNGRRLASRSDATCRRFFETGVRGQKPVFRTIRSLRLS